MFINFINRKAQEKPAIIENSAMILNPANSYIAKLRDLVWPSNDKISYFSFYTLLMYHKIPK